MTGKHSGGADIDSAAFLNAVASNVLYPSFKPTSRMESSRLSSRPGSCASVTRGSGGGSGVIVVVVVVTGLGVAVGAVDFASVVVVLDELGITAQITSAATAITIKVYDRLSPTRARSRPRCPVRLICDRPRCPNTAPAGANRNANTTDNVAKVLASPFGADGGGPAGTT